MEHISDQILYKNISKAITVYGGIIMDKKKNNMYIYIYKNTIHTHKYYKKIHH